VSCQGGSGAGSIEQGRGTGYTRREEEAGKRNKEQGAGWKPEWEKVVVAHTFVL
jgi:hypothetical protein